MKKKHIIVLLGCVVCFGSCQKKSFVLTKIEGKQITVSDSIAEDENIDAAIAPYRAQLDKDMTRVLSYAPKTYTKNDGHLNTALGNLMADIVFSEADPVFYKRTQKHIDAVLLNHGGIRSIISKGNITTETAYSVMPFENSIVVVALKGQQMDSMMHYLSYAKRPHPVQGIQLTLNKDYSINNAKIKGEIIKKNKTYYLATNDYLFEGGDGMRFFKPNDSVFFLNYKIRNAMIDYFKKTDTIRPVIDQRFIQLN